MRTEGESQSPITRFCVRAEPLIKVLPGRHHNPQQQAGVMAERRTDGRMFPGQTLSSHDRVRGNVLFLLINVRTGAQLYLRPLAASTRPSQLAATS